MNKFANNFGTAASFLFGFSVFSCPIFAVSIHSFFYKQVFYKQVGLRSKKKEASFEAGL